MHIAARVLAQAGAGEIWCSRTVKDLVAGSGFAFTDRGAHRLKGVPEPWQLFAWSWRRARRSPNRDGAGAGCSVCWRPSATLRGA